MAFQDWAEAMYDNFEALVVQEDETKTREIRLKGQTARPDENARVYQFTFDADFFFVLAPPEIPTMGTLDHTEVMK